MTDVILQLSQNKLARTIVARAKLPIPLPEKLERPDGPASERLLEGKTVLVVGDGALSGELSRTLARAGAQALVGSARLAQEYAGAGEAYGRGARTVEPSTLEGEHVDAIVLDGTAFTSPSDLKQLYLALHPTVRALTENGRVLVLGRPPQQAKNLEQAATRQALEGFVRSLAKEIGGKAATANLVYVEEGADDRLPAVLRFFLGKASAFVTGQPLYVSKLTRAIGGDPWTQPLEGRVALVTGAARGIGEATAHALAAAGAHVVCLDRPEDDARLSTVARDVGGSLLACDLLDASAPRAISQHLVDRHAGVDIVVHNAGVTRDRTLGRMSEAQWDQTLDVNLTAILRITSALLDGALRDGGRIVSLSSIAGIAGNHGQTNYGASKAGLIGFTRHLSGLVASRGVTVNAVAPGFIETQMTAAVPMVVREAGRRLSALGQGGLPEDVARTIVFLSEPGSVGVTGQVLRVCGGALIGA
jgi:3-oxoacyl-[acyl-carrier protein] reductase